MSDDTVEIKTAGLDKLLKALKAPPPVARVGIFGSQNARPDGNSNATIGAAHEFGTTTLPIRSFLRVPISDNLQKKMESSGVLDKETLNQVVASGTVIPWLTKVAILAHNIVLEAFDTGGFGKWKPSNMAHKKLKQTLIEDGYLLQSINYEVKE